MMRGLRSPGPGLVMRRPHTIARTWALAALAALLAGCGDSGNSAGRGGSSSARGVIASAADCVAFGPGAVDACARAIERAVTSHETTPAHNSLQTCEDDIGAGMCERGASGRYRPRLSAFLVTIGEHARAEPLYPAAAGTVGFRTANMTTLAASDHSLAFSRLALSVAEAQAAPKGKRRR